MFTVTIPHMIAAGCIFAVLLRYGSKIRPVVDQVADAVKLAGPAVPPDVAAEVEFARKALDAFEDSAIEQEFARRLAATVDKTRIDEVMAEIKQAIRARLTPVPSALPIVTVPNPAADPKAAPAR